MIVWLSRRCRLGRTAGVRRRSFDGRMNVQVDVDVDVDVDVIACGESIELAIQFPLVDFTRSGIFYAFNAMSTLCETQRYSFLLPSPALLPLLPLSPCTAPDTSVRSYFISVYR
jgi:hypothetical protein